MPTLPRNELVKLPKALPTFNRGTLAESRASASVPLAMFAALRLDSPDPFAEMLLAVMLLAMNPPRASRRTRVLAVARFVPVVRALARVPLEVLEAFRLV